jgi:hypothetical protein
MADEEKTPNGNGKKTLDQKWKIARDILLFFGGMVGVANEAFFQATTDPTLLILFGAMMGLPAFLRKDEDK